MKKTEQIPPFLFPENNTRKGKRKKKRKKGKKVTNNRQREKQEDKTAKLSRHKKPAVQSEMEIQGLDEKRNKNKEKEKGKRKKHIHLLTQPCTT